VILFVLFVVLAFGFRTTQRIIGSRELSREIARLDAEDPGWRLSELNAAREKTRPPENENSSPVVARVDTLIPKGWRLFQALPKRNPDELRPYNRKFPPRELLTGPHEVDSDNLPLWEIENLVNGGEPTQIGNIVESTQEARTLGLTLRAMPKGFRALVFPDNPLDVSTKETVAVRMVAELLRDDALLAAHTNEPTRGLHAVHAILNAGRSISDEPILIAQLARAACGTIAADACMRTLGLTNPKTQLAELRELQTALATEAEEPLLLIGLRAERATYYLILENIDNGKLVDYIVAHGGKRTHESLPDRLFERFLDGFNLRDQSKFLELSSQTVAAAKLPTHQQTAALSQVEQEVHSLWGPMWDHMYRRTRLFMPATERFGHATLRNRAALLTAATGIACERFRLTRGRWPTSLDEIPKDILPAIPLDPFNSKPLTLTRFDDGIAVCSVGGTGQYGRGFGGEKVGTGPLGGNDIGCRLYNPEVRGLPPLPPKPKVDPFAPNKPDDEKP
jgi:hypothetical protein